MALNNKITSGDRNTCFIVNSRVQIYAMYIYALTCLSVGIHTLPPQIGMWEHVYTHTHAHTQTHTIYV